MRNKALKMAMELFIVFVGVFAAFWVNIPDLRAARKQLANAFLRSESIDELYADFNAIKQNLDNFINLIDKLDQRIYDYIVYHNIIRFLTVKNTTLTEKHIKDLVTRVVYEDIPKLYSEKSNPQIAEKILSRIAGSDEINIQTLSQSMSVSQKEINNNLEILVNAELLNILYAYGGIDSKVSKAQKYFFMSPSIRKAILTPLMKSDITDIYAKMLEDIVVLYLKRIFEDSSFLSFSSIKGQRNPDLIIETLNQPLLLEVGINKKTTKQLLKSKIKYKYGIIINSKIENIELHENIVIIPLKYFLLL